MDWFFKPLPATRIAALRILVGLFATIWLLVRAPALVGLAFRPSGPWTPVGLLALLDLSGQPPPAALVLLTYVLGIATGIAFTLGLRFSISGPLFAVALTLLGTFRSSFGHISHTEHLLVIHTWLIALSPAADRWSLDVRSARVRSALSLPSGSGSTLLSTAPAGYGWPVRALILLTAVAYVIAGAAKLRIAGMHWGDGEVLRVHVAWDNLRKIELGDAHSPLGAYLVRFEGPWMALGLSSLVLELGAPLALVHEKIGRAWALCMWAFHAGVAAIMFILFAYPLSGVAFACLLRPEESSRLARVGAWLERTPDTPGKL